MRQKIQRARLLAKEFLDDDRGQGNNMAGMAVSVIVSLTVGGLVAAFLIPIAIGEIVNVSTTNWSSGAASLWDILDVIIVLSVFLFFVSAGMMAGDGV